MDTISKKITNLNNKEFKFFKIVKIKDEKPVFSNDILDFWSPLGHINGYKDGYEVGICRIKNGFNYFTRMESHKFSQEILIPIDYDMFVPIAPPDLEPDIGKILVPAVSVGEMIILNEGVWHFAAGPIKSKVLNYFVLLKEGTPNNDLVMTDLKVKVNITVD